MGTNIHGRNNGRALQHVEPHFGAYPMNRAEGRKFIAAEKARQENEREKNYSGAAGHISSGAPPLPRPNRKAPA